MKRPPGRRDDGAALIIVLIIVTVISVVSGVILSQADTSVRTTVVLRDQASANYAADSAAQAIITQLKNNKFACTPADPSVPPLGTAGTPFYSPVSTTDGPLNASANCAPDTTNGVTTSTSGSGVAIGTTNEPTDAILTVGTTSGSTEGQTYGGNNVVCVEGGSVRSNGTITANATLGVRASGTGQANDCSTGTPLSVAAFGACSGTFNPTPCTHMASTQTTPTAPTPTLAITAANTNQAAVCQKVGSTWYAAFLPGKYSLLTSSSASSLSTPCKNGSNWVSADVAWFTPGTYYFDYNAAWTVPGTVIGGTPTKPAGTVVPGLDGTSAATLAASTLSNLTQASAFPGACASPAAQTSNGGAELVFGSASTMTLPASNNFEICAPYSSTSVPIAIYGTPTTLTVGGGSIAAESGCVATPGCSGGTLFNTDVNGKSTFHIQGYTFAPTARVELTFKNNSTGQVFNWGLLVRAFSITVNGSSPSIPFVQLPKQSVGIVTTTTYSIRYLNVWTCPASASPCPQAGPPNVRLKVQTQSDGTIKVLSWSEQH